MCDLIEVENNLVTSLSDYDPYLDYDGNKCQLLKKSLKNVYDSLQSLHLLASPIPQLLIEDLNDEQIWQEIELDNKISYSYILKKVSNLLKTSNNDDNEVHIPLFIPTQVSSDEDSNYGSDNEEKFEEEIMEPENEIEEEMDENKDDLFPRFKVNKKHLDEKEQDIEYYGDSSDKEHEDDDISADKKKPLLMVNKSAYEMKQEKIQKYIQNLEDSNITVKKPWNMIGEISAETRPVNSLLEQYLDFSRATAPPPAVTQESTEGIEAIIIRRIRDKCFDDVARKDDFKNRKEESKNLTSAILLDDGKSKLSLSQVYEQEYLGQGKETNVSGLSHEPTKELSEIHSEIKTSLAKLFTKLDAMCNANYKPTLPEAEIRIIPTNSSSKTYDPPLALQMEDLTGLIGSEAHQIAPQEASSSKNRLLDLADKLESAKKVKPKDSKDQTVQVKKGTKGRKVKESVDKKKRFDFVRRWQEMDLASKLNQNPSKTMGNSLKKKKKSIHNLIGDGKSAVSGTVGVNSKRIKL